MLKYAFKSTSPEINPPISFVVEAPTPIQILAEVEKKIGGECDIAGDLSIDIRDCLEAIADGQDYQRFDFASQESNFELTPA